MGNASTLPAPGRPGRAGASVPAQPTGYQPESLDKAIARHIAVAERAINQVEALGERVQVALDALRDTQQKPGNEVRALEQAELLTVLFDRMSKATMNVVKATDELSRLRSFVAGGPDSRPDLGDLSDAELAAIVLGAAAGARSLREEAAE